MDQPDRLIRCRNEIGPDSKLVKNKSARPNHDRKTFYSWQWPQMKAERKLLPSGLLDPVRLLESSGGA